MYHEWEKPLSSIERARGKERKQKKKQLPPPDGHTSRRPGSGHSSSPTETSHAALPGASNPSYWPADSTTPQAVFQQSTTPSNLAMPSFDPGAFHSRPGNRYLAPPSLPSSATVAHTRSGSGGNWYSSPDTGLNANSNGHPQNPIYGTRHTYNPAASVPDHFNLTNIPPDNLPLRQFPQSIHQPFVTHSLQYSQNHPSAHDRGLTRVRPATASYDLENVPVPSGLALTSRPRMNDPHPSLYIDSLQNVHGGSYAYFHRQKLPTILAMNLENLDGGSYRIATRCVHYRDHDPKAWDDFNQSNGVSSPRDDPSERNKCFMAELAIEKQLPSPKELNQVWKNSCRLAVSEQSSGMVSPLFPQKTITQIGMWQAVHFS
jgi:hypothetical protein